MISKVQMMPIILEKFPAFGPIWKKHLELWKGEEAGIYNDIAEFANFVVDACERRENESVTAAFSLIEEFLVEGDEEVRNAASIGFLEDVRNISAWRRFGPEPFIQRLGPQSKVAWAAIEEIWRGKTSLADVVRAEIRAEKKKE